MARRRTSPPLLIRRSCGMCGTAPLIPFQILPGHYAVSFKLIADSHENVIKKIEVYTSTATPPSQILKADKGEAPYRDADYFMAVDVDFDGYQDIGLLSWWGATGNEGWQFWRFDPKTEMFVPDPQVSALGRPQFNSDTQTIDSFSKGGWCTYTTTTYRYRNGKLIAMKEKRCKPSSEKPEESDCDCVTTTVK